MTRRLLRYFAIGLAAGVMLPAAGVGGGVLWLRTSLPQLDGQVSLQGPDRRVEILRDAYGVVTVRAGTPADAAFALGFAHAQDRFGQMEMMRRTGTGRMAELVGASAVPLDRFFRGLGLYRQAREQERTLSPRLRAELEAYAAGVNAWRTTHDGALPWLLELLLYDPEAWQVADSLLWGRMMALQLLGNWRTELLRARLAERLSPEQLDDLWPEDVGGDPPDTVAPVGTGGSNLWAVRSPPVLANDPHLGLSIPGIWYLARIEVGDSVLAGATAPGVPMMVLGHNGAIAWGMTNAATDMADLVREPEVLSTRTETISVRWSDPETLVVRETASGVVLSDLSDRYPEGWSLESPTFLGNDRTVEALAQVNRATSWAGFEAALASFHSPHQNVAYADRDGRIGMISPARVPLREQPGGLVPSARRGWERMIPYDELPRVVDPPSGRLLNANNRMVGPDYPYFLGRDWRPPWRARRIATLLADGAGHRSIQMDSVSLSARTVLPHLLRAVPVPELAAWDGNMDRNRHEPLLYIAWVRELLRGIFADELGPRFSSWWRYRPQALVHVLTRRPEWCDVVSTPGIETCDDLIRDALARARSMIGDRYGSDRPVWGQAHAARFSHALAGRVPLLRSLIEREIPADGGPDTVNRGGVRFSDEAHPFRHVHGAGYRAIYTLDDLDRSEFIITPGQSGNPFSPWYDDLMTRWRDGDPLALAGTTAPVHRLVIVSE